MTAPPRTLGDIVGELRALPADSDDAAVQARRQELVGEFCAVLRRWWQGEAAG